MHNMHTTEPVPLLVLCILSRSMHTFKTCACVVQLQNLFVVPLIKLHFFFINLFDSSGYDLLLVHS